MLMCGLRAIVQQGCARLDMLFTLPVSFLVILPLWRIYDRAGINPLWALLVFLPVVGLFLPLLVLAFARWPKIEGEASVAPRLKSGWRS
jgi:hypothetical protein